MGCSERLQDGYHPELDRLTGDKCCMVANVHVYLAAHAELPGQIDTGLNREARVGQKVTFIL
jgi:hypothetical protein